MGTPIFYEKSAFMSLRSILYDYHCLYITLLLILKLISIKSVNSYEYNDSISKELTGNVNEIFNSDKYKESIKYFSKNLRTYICTEVERNLMLNILLFLMYSQLVWANYRKKVDTKVPQVINGVGKFITINNLTEYEDYFTNVVLQ